MMQRSSVITGHLLLLLAFLITPRAPVWKATRLWWQIYSWSRSLLVYRARTVWMGRNRCSPLFCAWDPPIKVPNMCRFEQIINFAPGFSAWVTKDWAKVSPCYLFQGFDSVVFCFHSMSLPSCYDLLRVILFSIYKKKSPICLWQSNYYY